MSDIERGWWAMKLRALFHAIRVCFGWFAWKWKRRRWFRKLSQRATMLTVHVAGLVAGASAAWSAGGLVAGLVAITVGCFVLEWRLKDV